MSRDSLQYRFLISPVVAVGSTPNTAYASASFPLGTTLSSLHCSACLCTDPACSQGLFRLMLFKLFVGLLDVGVQLVFQVAVYIVVFPVVAQVAVQVCCSDRFRLLVASLCSTRLLCFAGTCNTVSVAQPPATCQAAQAAVVDVFRRLLTSSHPPRRA